MKKRSFMAMPPALKKYWDDKRKKSKKRKTTTRKRRTTRKGDLTLKRKKAYSSKKKSYKPRKKSSFMKLPKVPKVLTKVAMGMGAASLAAIAVGFIAPQFAPIARPVAALVAGGIPGVAAELLINQGMLSNITGIFTGGGGGINEARLAGGL